MSGPLHLQRAGRSITLLVLVAFLLVLFFANEAVASSRVHRHRSDGGVLQADSNGETTTQAEESQAESSLVDPSVENSPHESVALHDLAQSTQSILMQQTGEAKRCFPLLYNYSVPKVIDHTFFPKRQSLTPRFRFHCGVSNVISINKQSGITHAETIPVYLSSYNVDGFSLPEWVAFRIRRPIYGNSFLPAENRKKCAMDGSQKFSEVDVNGIQTPDEHFLDTLNAELLTAGRDPRSGYVKGQLALPTHLLTCQARAGTYGMTNVIPMNKYLYTENWRHGDEALRRYVARDVPVPQNGSFTMHQLLELEQYHPLFVVAGPHFAQAAVQKFDWSWNGDSENVQRGVIPHAIWQAAVDPAKVVSAPEQAAIAWYCDNVNKGPWPPQDIETDGEKRYQQGPKLCKVMSLDDLAKLAGVVPFPDLPRSVTSAKPISGNWFLPAQF